MRFVLCSLFILLIVTGASAQEYRNQFGFRSDNDSYLLNGSDRYYTNGLFLYFNHGLKVNTDSSSLANKILGFEAGQKMFNAQSGSVPYIFYDDRPFAGYLYGAVNLNLLYKNESNLKLTAQVGVVGPSSLAEKAQQAVHHLFGQYDLDGWQYQIPDNVELNLSAEYNRLLTRGKSVDLSLTSYANLGNGFTGAGVGPLVRIGKFNQLYFSQTTRSTVTANSNVKPLNSSEFFFYYKPQFNWVGYDATIQGGIGQQDKFYYPGSFRHIEPVIFSQQVGAVYSTHRWVYEAYALFETKDTKEMVREGHQWGTVEILYKFN